MTTSHSMASASLPAARRTVTARPVRALRAAAIAACVPYLGLKIAWLTGHHVGIPEDSELLSPDGRATLYALNLLTVLMDATVVVLALALTRPWGRRLPAWLMLAPLWLATGLLTPIAVAFPASLLAGGGGHESDDAFLDPWVFTLVYSGFSVQAIALGGLFALYVRERWGHALRGRLAEFAPPARRATSVAAVLATLPPLAVNLLWLLGSTVGLREWQIEERDAASRVVAASHALFALMAAASVVLLALRPARLGSLRLATAVAPAWVGGAAQAAWGGWMLLTSGVALGSAEPDERFTPLALLTYAGQVIAGLLVLLVLARPLAERTARPATRTA